MSLDFNYASSKTGIIQNAQNLVSSVVNQFIVRPLGAPNLTGISGFIFDILDDEEIVIDSDITDNYVEGNYSVQDHISLRPIRFTLRGYTGEVVDDLPNALASIYTRVKGLQTLGGLAPQFNTQDAQFYAAVNNVVQKVTNVINQVKSAFQLFSDSSTTTNRQQKVYQYFFNMWQTRQLCTVETPFAIFENMAIESIRALQSGATRFVSEFSITFKQIQTVNSITLTPNAGSLISQNLGTVSNLLPVPGGVFKQVVAPVSNLGSTSGTATNKQGLTFSVANVTASKYIQQAALPNQY